MRKWPVVLLLGLALLLAGCSGEVSTDLYIQDILGALELDEEVLTIGTISIEAGGSEFMEGMVNFFNMYFREPTNFREQSQDYSTYTMADVKIPVLDITDGELDLSDDIIALVVAFDEEEGRDLVRARGQPRAICQRRRLCSGGILDHSVLQRLQCAGTGDQRYPGDSAAGTAECVCQSEARAVLGRLSAGQAGRA